MFSPLLRVSSALAILGVLILWGPVSAQMGPTRSFPGCYDVVMGPWNGGPPIHADSIYYAPPSRLILDSNPPPYPRSEAERLIRVAPNALPSIHEITTWTTRGDTLVLGFSTGLTGFVARMPLGNGRLKGKAFTFTDVEPSPHHDADFELLKVDCGTPPHPSMEDQRFLFRSLELLDGTRLGLAEEMAYDPAWRRKEGKVSAWIDHHPTRRFPTAEEIRVSPNRQGQIALFVIRLNPQTPFDDLVAELERELGSPVSRELTTRSGLEMELVHWGNRMTSLGLSRARRVGEEWTVGVTLADRRLRR